MVQDETVPVVVRGMSLGQKLSELNEPKKKIIYRESHLFFISQSNFSLNLLIPLSVCRPRCCLRIFGLFSARLLDRFLLLLLYNSYSEVHFCRLPLQVMLAFTKHRAHPYTVYTTADSGHCRAQLKLLLLVCLVFSFMHIYM